jgi:hypothetical protein
MTLLFVHLKHNLWVGSEYDMISFHDDLGIHLDIAMAVRRGGAPGPRTPDGILTRYVGTHVGRIISKIDADPDPFTIDLGFYLLSLSEDSITAINRGIEIIMHQAAQSQSHHDFTIATGDGSSGLTVHCNNDETSMALQRLGAYCKMRKYAQKATKWFGLCISPGRGDLRFGLAGFGEWKQDDAMDVAVRKMMKPIPATKVDATLSKMEKLRRNDPCPCGSGRKFKKCCDKGV